MVPTDITTNPDLTFLPLEDEQYRVYEFTGGDQIRINAPVALHVSKSGGHRILDSMGISHYIPAGWIHLFWVVVDGQPHFAF